MAKEAAAQRMPVTHHLLLGANFLKAPKALLCERRPRNGNQYTELATEVIS